jgi:hypothetical protein
MKCNKSVVVLVTISFLIGSMVFFLPAHGETGNTTEKTDNETVKITSVPEFLAYFPEHYQLQPVEASLTETEVDRLTAFTKINREGKIMVDKSYQISNAEVDINSLFNDYLVIVNWASMVSNDPAITKKVTDLYTSSYWIALSGLFTGESQN